MPTFAVIVIAVLVTHMRNNTDVMEVISSQQGYKKLCYNGY